MRLVLGGGMATLVSRPNYFACFRIFTNLSSLRSAHDGTILLRFTTSNGRYAPP